MHRYIVRVAVLEVGPAPVELWLGIVAAEPIDSSEWPDIVPADGMTDEELAIVKRWVAV